MKYIKPYNESIRDEMKPKSDEELPKEHSKLIELLKYIQNNSELEPELNMIDGIDDDYPAIKIHLKFNDDEYLWFEITYNMYGNDEYNLSIENEVESFKTIEEVYNTMIIEIKEFINGELEKIISKKDKIEKILKSIEN